jgi:hypothetical protein
MDTNVDVDNFGDKIVEGISVDGGRQDGINGAGCRATLREGLF